MTDPYIRLVAGASRVEWCDECLRSHETVTVYAINGDDLTTAAPAGTYTPDHAEEGIDDDD